MTGRYASEVGVLDYVGPESGAGLDPRFSSWPTLLKAAGYRTGLIGKWHLGHSRPEHHPTRHGYEFFVGFLGGGVPARDPKLDTEAGPLKLTGLTDDLLTEHALRFLDERRDAPFLLSLHFRAPHKPYLPVTEQDWSHHRDRFTWAPQHPGVDPQTVQKEMKEYDASITGMDRNLGRVLAKLQELDLDQKTIVIFTSDHGYNVGHHGIWAKGNGVWLVDPPPPQLWPHITGKWRPNMWDTSLRVPLVIRWPGVVEPGSTVNQTVDFTDFFPTLCAMAGVRPPSDMPQRGRDFSPLLRGTGTAWENDLYAEYDMDHGGTSTHMRIWRTDRWKLMIDFKNPGRVELYDLRSDPQESRNLAEENSAKIRQVRRTLTDKIVNRMRAIGDPVHKLASQSATR